MNLGRILKESFSPHEIAIMGLVLAYALGISGLVGIATGRVGFGIILWLTAAIISIAFHELSRCGACGKSPLRRTQGDLNWFEYYMTKYAIRLWPERECSGCGTSLTGPEQN